jgi:predicted DNA-binding ribbon-helix-helix protein
MEIRPSHKERRLNSTIVKHSIVLAGHKTSITLEDGFWDGLHVIAQNENITIATLIARIDRQRIGCNLSSSIRLFVLHYFKALSQMSSSKAPSDLSPSAHRPAR